MPTETYIAMIAYKVMSQPGVRNCIYQDAKAELKSCNSHWRQGVKGNSVGIKLNLIMVYPESQNAKDRSMQH